MDVDCSPEISSKQTPPPLGATGQSEASELEDIRDVLWGNQISDTVFARWSQGGLGVLSSGNKKLCNAVSIFILRLLAGWLVSHAHRFFLSLQALSSAKRNRRRWCSTKEALVPSSLPFRPFCCNPCCRTCRWLEELGHCIHLARYDYHHHRVFAHLLRVHLLALISFALLLHL